MQLKLTKKQKIKKWSLIIVALILLCILPFSLSRAYYVHVAIMCLFWAYLSTSWNMLCGFSGLLSLGHGIYVAAGAYVTTIIFNTFGLTPWISLLFACVVAVLMAVIIGFPTFNLRGAYYALSTVAIGEGIVVLLENFRVWKIGKLTIQIGGAEGLTMHNMGNAPLYMQWHGKIPYYFMILIMLIIALLVSRYIKENRLGYQLAAVKDDEDAARALGINIRKVKLEAAIVSAIFTALGGVFYVLIIRFLEPESVASGAYMSNQIVFGAIVGGSGTVLGPAIGGFLLNLISSIIQYFLGGSVQGLHLFIYGLIVAVMIIFKPGGIMSIFEKLYYKYLGITVSEGLDDEEGGVDSNG
ncbi:branched-chain amino acid ABC transporter permease [Anaerovorax odorimutans]|uniref:branched-chain amino acid ABC transporter permease n=1 Tax=Anaerovorax odorimutans TaxID=109327 RepID=UPI00068520C2|nr:branched-chain amino acid ABC transporter permease [Anaerovorax odorimutans]